MRSLWSRLCNHIAIQRDCRLRQQSAVPRCAGIQRDRFCGEYHALEVRGRSNGHTSSTADLPEDVLGQRSTGQQHARGTRLGEIACHLEYPDIIGATIECDIRIYQYAGAPLVETGNKTLMALG